MAAAPVVAKLKAARRIPGSGHVDYPKPKDPEPQPPPVDGGKHIPPGDRTPDQAQRGAQPNNDDTSGKNKDMGAKKPKRTPPKAPIPPYKRPSPGGSKIPAPNPKKKGPPLKTGLATYASQIR